MALNLDTRQRAMLQEMGITVWAPKPAAVAAAVAAPAPAPMPSAVAVAERMAASAPVAQPAMAVQQPTAAPAPAAAPVAAAASPAPVAASVAAPVASHAAEAVIWQMAAAQRLYPEATGGSADDAWLIIWECPTPAAPLDGESGKLLDNMLRALRLQHSRHVWLAPVQRSNAQPLDALAQSHAATVDWQPLEALLPDSVQQAQPARVLLMGLSAARAVLNNAEALGRLRAQLHQVQGVPAMVTYDPAYLLRSPHAKPAAWADLCRAHGLRAPQRA